PRVPRRLAQRRGDRADFAPGTCSSSKKASDRPPLGGGGRGEVDLNRAPPPHGWGRARAPSGPPPSLRRARGCSTAAAPTHPPQSEAGAVLERSRSVKADLVRRRP